MTEKTVVEIASARPVVEDPPSKGIPTPFIDGLLRYCASLGKPLSREDFLIGLPIADGDLDEVMALRALDRIGLDGVIHTKGRLPKKHLPVCAAMHDDRFEVVLDLDRDYAYLADDTCPEG